MASTAQEIAELERSLAASPGDAVLGRRIEALRARAGLDAGVLSSRLFSWQRGVGVACLSDLGHGVERRYRAGDQLRVRSVRTGTVLVFTLTGFVVGVEGDLVSVSLRSSCSRFSLTLFND